METKEKGKGKKPKRLEEFSIQRQSRGAKNCKGGLKENGGEAGGVGRRWELGWKGENRRQV